MNQDQARPSRRLALAAATGGALATGLALAGCGKGGGGPKDGEDVSAVEDLMREHGVLRRILIVYRETAGWLAQGRTDFDAAALGQAADLFRAFGEDYHERQLEEQHMFPTLQKAGGAGGALVPTLLAQHDRGREVTAFVRARCATGKIAAADAGALARVLQDFERMYTAHTAFEDTVAFQAWKQALSEKQRDEAGETFEKIERSHFGGDGFDMAVGQIAQIEQKLGLGDLARYTAAAPPAAAPAG
jgi:hemerythrin-like domain-containing protein